MISKMSDVVIFLYTCSHPHEIEQYLKLFSDNNIHFKYVNENQSCYRFKGYGCYDKKPYMNVLIENDWSLSI
jgi:hypothetical protein